MIEFVRSDNFEEWLADLSDGRGKARILGRPDRANMGNFGDCRPVGEGVSEMRIDVGPGYRVYFVHRGITICLLLAGGDKSTQGRDIARAIRMARALKEQKK